MDPHQDGADQPRAIRFFRENAPLLRGAIPVWARGRQHSAAGGTGSAARVFRQRQPPERLSTGVVIMDGEPHTVQATCYQALHEGSPGL